MQRAEESLIQLITMQPVPPTRAVRVRSSFPDPDMSRVRLEPPVEEWASERPAINDAVSYETESVREAPDLALVRPLCWKSEKPTDGIRAITSVSEFQVVEVAAVPPTLARAVKEATRPPMPDPTSVSNDPPAGGTFDPTRRPTERAVRR